MTTAVDGRLRNATARAGLVFGGVPPGGRDVVEPLLVGPYA